MNPTYDIVTQGTAAIVSVTGDFNMSSADVSALVASCAMRPQRLIVSLENCTFCDAAGLTTLVRAHEREDPMLFVVLPETALCRRVFVITGLVKLLRIVPNVDAALRLEPMAA